MVNFFIAFLSVFFAGQQASMLFGFSSSEYLHNYDQTQEANPQTGMTKATNAANYIFWLEQLQPSIRETDENHHIGPGDLQSVELEKLHFSYPLRPDARVLRGINLHVRPLAHSSSDLLTALTFDLDQKGAICCICWSVWLWKKYHDQHA